MEPLFQSLRLYFRAFTPADSDLIYQLNKDPEVIKYVHEPVTTPELAVEVLNHIILPQYKSYNHGRWAVHLRSNDEFVGWCGLKKTAENTFPDLGYRFFKKHWGNGYATEAAKKTISYGFDNLHLKGIYAAAHIHNLASIHVLEKCGMTFEGEKMIDETPVKTFIIFNPEFPK